MKRVFAILLALTMILCMAACGTNEDKAMTYEEYMAAEMETEVVIEAYVQGHQSWWNDQITVYLQDKDGGYFAYNMACSEEDAAKLTVGTKIRVTGTKTEWAGEVELAAGSTFEFVEGDTWVAEAKDLTNVLGTDDLINYQNQLVSFKGLTIEAIEYQNGAAGASNDIYVTFKLGEGSYSFCVESYLTAPGTNTYDIWAELEAGDVVDVEGFLYWYNGVNTHMTSVTKVG